MEMKTMLAALLLAAQVGLSSPCLAEASMDFVPARQVERFLRAVYCCDPEGIEALSTADVRISYPIFEQLLGTRVVEGQAAVRALRERFCSRWSDPQLTIHESITEGYGVVLIWSFSATATTGATDAPPEPTRWGGMSYFRLDPDGKVMLELGEESTPGPWVRLNGEAGRH